MIKKTILMLLVLVGGVMQAGATTLHVGMENNYTGDVYVYRFGGTSADNWDSMGDGQKATFDAIKYGRRWYTIDMNENSKAVVRWDNWSKQTYDVSDISGDDYYIYISTNSGTDGKYYAGQLDNPFWTGLYFMNSVDNNWTSSVTNNMTVSLDKNEFTYEFSRSQLSNVSSIYFRFKHVENVYFCEDGVYKNDWTQLYPETNNTLVSIATPITEYHQGVSDNSWELNIPSYDFTKIVITAKYYNENGYRWKITADAYISPLLSKEYGTFSVAVPLDFSKATGLTAYYASAVNGSTVTMTKLDGAVAKNTGLLLKKAEGDISIPVAATGTDLSSSNSLKYGTGDNVSSDNIYNRYVLATQSGVQNFYKLSTTGNIVPTGKAYLEIPATTSAPSLSIDIDGETTGIEVINAEMSETGTAKGQAFDLSGRRIAEPTKGVYIMNGKKMIVK